MWIEPLSYTSKWLIILRENACEAGLLLLLFLLILETPNYTCKLFDLMTLSKWLNTLLVASISLYHWDNDNTNFSSPIGQSTGEHKCKAFENWIKKCNEEM